MSDRFQEAMAYARAKHPEFASDPGQALAILVEEVGEVAKALAEGTPDELATELCHVEVVCQRWREWIDPAEVRVPIQTVLVTPEERAMLSGAGMRGATATPSLGEGGVKSSGPGGHGPSAPLRA